MKKYLLIELTVLSILTTYSFTPFNGKVDDLFKTLGLPESNAKVHIWKSFELTFKPSNPCASVVRFGSAQKESKVLLFFYHRGAQR